MKYLLVPLFSVAVAGAAFAEGDAEKGEASFKKCKSCHMIAADDGTVIQKGGKTGPNLYGVVGRQAGSTDFNYGKDIVAAGNAGLVWDEDNFTAFAQNPTGFLRENLGDTGAKSKMTFKLKKGGEDIFAYLSSVAE